MDLPVLIIMHDINININFYANNLKDASICMVHTSTNTT